MTTAQPHPDAPPAASPAPTTLLVTLVVFASALNYVDRQVLALLKPTLSAEFGWSNADFAHLGSAFQLATAFSYLFIGWAVDRFGVRWSYGVGVAVWSIAGMAHAAAASVRDFVIARIALAVGEAVNTPAGLKTAATYIPAERRSVALGIINSAPNVGAILTPLAVPPLALAFGWHAAFLVTGALGFVWLAFWIVSTRTIRPAPGADAAVGARAVGVLDVLRNRGAWAVIGAKAIFDQVWWFVLFWTPAFFNQQFHLDQGALGGPIAVVFAMAALGALSSGYLFDGLRTRGLSRLGARKTSLLIFALLILPVSLALQAQNPWIAAGIIGLALFAHQGFSTNVFGLTADVVPASAVGKTISFAAFAGNLSGMGIIELAGWSLDHGHGYWPMFAIASVAYLIALGWIHLLAPRAVYAEAA